MATLNILNRFTPKVYFSEKTTKTHIVLHHTAGSSVQGAIDTWLKAKTKVGTHYIISRSGEASQVIPIENWSYSLGLKQGVWAHRMDWERNGVTIELVALGGLKWSGKNWVSWANTIVPNNEVEVLVNPFRGYAAYHAYTAAQIDSLNKLLENISAQTGIVLRAGDMDAFFSERTADFSPKKPTDFKAVKTIFTHVNFRPAGDKQDCYPSRLLTKMLGTYAEKKKRTLNPQPQASSPQVQQSIKKSKT